VGKKTKRLLWEYQKLTAKKRMALGGTFHVNQADGVVFVVKFVRTATAVIVTVLSLAELRARKEEK